MPAVALVAVWRLDKDGGLGLTLSKHFSTNVIQPYTLQHRYNTFTIFLLKCITNTGNNSEILQVPQSEGFEIVQ
jgi:hypothetical protein